MLFIRFNPGCAYFIASNLSYFRIYRPVKVTPYNLTNARLESLKVNYSLRMRAFYLDNRDERNYFWDVDALAVYPEKYGSL